MSIILFLLGATLFYFAIWQVLERKQAWTAFALLGVSAVGVVLLFISMLSGRGSGSMAGWIPSGWPAFIKIILLLAASIVLLVILVIAVKRLKDNEFGDSVNNRKFVSLRENGFLVSQLPSSELSLQSITSDGIETIAFTDVILAFKRWTGLPEISRPVVQIIDKRVNSDQLDAVMYSMDMFNAGLEYLKKIECSSTEETSVKLSPMLEVVIIAFYLWVRDTMLAHAALPVGFDEQNPDAEWNASTSRELPLDWDQRRAAVRIRDQERCATCGTDLKDRAGNTHHIVPRSQGGSHSLKNLALLCEGCHSVIDETHEGMHWKNPIDFLRKRWSRIRVIEPHLLSEHMADRLTLYRVVATTMKQLYLLRPDGRVRPSDYLVPNKLEILEEDGTWQPYEPDNAGLV